jgi:predicted helicase
MESSIETTSFYEIYGSREKKYEFLLSQNLKTINWDLITPRDSKYFFLCNKDLTLDSEYSLYFPISEIFVNSASGVQTKRDNLVTDFDESSLLARMSEVLDKTKGEKEIREKYQIEDSSGWSLSKARQATFNFQKIENYEIRPFDYRYVYYDPLVLGRARYQDIRHMLYPNIGIVLMKQVALHQEYYSQFFVSENLIADRAIYSNRGTTYIFPLYLYPDENNGQKSVFQETRQANLSKSVVDDLKNKLGYNPDPEKVLYYLYAILHSSNYRTRYVEFLKIDFPRIPITSNNQLFCQLARYGEELVALHLMKSPKLDTPIAHFVGASGNLCVDPRHLKYDESSSSVLINKNGDKFVGVPKAVWEFYVGGYQVCQQWLKDRKGRILSLEEITYYQRIVVALQETMRLMRQIDEAIPGFPIT